MNISVSSFADTAHDFWGWWSDELASMLPAAMRGEATQRDRFDMFLGPDETVIEVVEQGAARRMQEPCSFDALSEEAWEQIEGFAEVHRLRLFLGDPDILEIPVTLPRASSGQIRSALALQLPSLVPIMPDQIDWDFIELSRDEKEIHILLGMARSSRLDALEQVFAEQGLMPPTFCAGADKNTFVLRKPLELAGSPISDKKMKLGITVAAMLAVIPIATISGAELLTSLNLDRAGRLENDLAPRLGREKEAQREEMVRRAAAPLLNIPSASNLLENLAQKLPASDWAVSSTQMPDGDFEFVADMANREAAEEALRKDGNIKQLRAEEEIATESLRSRVRYRISR